MAIQLPLSQLLQPVPLESWKQRIVDIAKRVGLKTDNWSTGGFMRTLVALFAEFHTMNGAAVPIIASSRFLDFAQGIWLTLLAKEGHDVDRIEATYASAAEGIMLTNSGSKFFEFDPGDVVVASSVTHRTFRCVTGGTLRPGVGQTLRLDVKAEEPGSAGNADVGTLTELVTTLLGVTCTNPVALVGIDEESDADLRERCRDSVAARSIGGVKRAYSYHAKSARRSDGSPIGVTRIRIPPAIGDGTGAVYIASLSGAIGSLDVDRVQEIFDHEVTHHGFTATALSAVNKSITAPCTIWIPESLGLTEEQVQEKVHDALRDYVSRLPIGGMVIPPATGRVYWTALLGVIGTAVPGCLTLQLTSESDIAVAGNEAPVWAGVLSDTTVIQVEEEEDEP